MFFSLHYFVLIVRNKILEIDSLSVEYSCRKPKRALDAILVKQFSPTDYYTQTDREIRMMVKVQCIKCNREDSSTKKKKSLRVVPMNTGM